MIYKSFAVMTLIAAPVMVMAVQAVLPQARQAAPAPVTAAPATPAPATPAPLTPTAAAPVPPPVASPAPMPAPMPNTSPASFGQPMPGAGQPSLAAGSGLPQAAPVRTVPPAAVTSLRDPNSER